MSISMDVYTTLFELLQIFNMAFIMRDIYHNTEFIVAFYAIKVFVCAILCLLPYQRTSRKTAYYISLP